MFYLISSLSFTTTAFFIFCLLLENFIQCFLIIVFTPAPFYNSSKIHSHFPTLQLYGILKITIPFSFAIYRIQSVMPTWAGLAYQDIHPWRGLTPLPLLQKQQGTHSFLVRIDNHQLLPHHMLECWLAWSCAGNHSCCDFMRSVVQSDPEDSVSL